MTTYAVGDVQGCYRELHALLERINFRPDQDELWFAGDLVNRGPESLDVLRFVFDLGDRAKVVLGNHDLHLLAAANGYRKLRRDDTLSSILSAPDRDRLLDWLRHCPLMHWDASLGFAMVHAGIPPQWSLTEALARAGEVETKLQSGTPGASLNKMYGNEPALWDDDLSGSKRRRYIINALTRMRYCTARGELDLKHSGPPEKDDAKFSPWFQIPGRKSVEVPIVFGHWATLEMRKPEALKFNAVHIDSGCVWGNALTAVSLPDLTFTREPSLQPKFHEH